MRLFGPNCLIEDTNHPMYKLYRLSEACISGYTCTSLSKSCKLDNINHSVVNSLSCEDNPIMLAVDRGKPSRKIVYGKLWSCEASVNFDELYWWLPTPLSFLCLGRVLKINLWHKLVQTYSCLPQLFLGEAGEGWLLPLFNFDYSQVRKTNFLFLRSTWLLLYLEGIGSQLRFMPIKEGFRDH